MGTAVITGAQEASPAANEIKVTAKKYEFDPSQIRVKKGDHVKLVITAVDHESFRKNDCRHAFP